MTAASIHPFRRRVCGRRAAWLLASILCACPVVLRGEPIAVRYPEGTVHALLVLRTLDGTRIADGDLTQVPDGGNITARLIFHFTDGSLHDETTVFSQHGRFRVVRDRLVQRGPTFPQPLEMSIDADGGTVTVRYQDDHGHQQQAAEHMDVPADLANGLMPVLLKNLPPHAPPGKLSFIAATPKPRLVRLAITSAGEEPFSTGHDRRMATHYVIKVEIGGLSGLFAPLVGKQPPDSHVWILQGAVPAFVKSEQPLYLGGPLWRIELATAARPAGN